MPSTTALLNAKRKRDAAELDEDAWDEEDEESDCSADTTDYDKEGFGLGPPPRMRRISPEERSKWSELSTTSKRLTAPQKAALKILAADVEANDSWCKLRWAAKKVARLKKARFESILSVVCLPV